MVTAVGGKDDPSPIPTQADLQGAVDLGSPIALAIRGFSTRAVANGAKIVIMVGVLESGQIFFEAKGGDPVYWLGALTTVQRLITDGLVMRPAAAIPDRKSTRL